MKYIVLLLMVGVTIWSVKGLVTDIRNRAKIKKEKMKDEQNEQDEQNETKP